MRRTTAAFTLVELLISVSIISILIAIGIASYATINKQSRDTKRKSDIEQVRSALEMYRAENGSYPATGGGIFTAVSSLSSDLIPTYIPSIPTDPRVVSPYIYQYKATNAANGLYYGYCLSGTLESSTPTDNSCVPDTGQNYGVKNP